MKDKKENYSQSAFYQSYKKHLKELRLYKCLLFFEDIFNKQQCGFRKGYNTQQCLLKMLEKWKRLVDGGNVFGTLLTDLSKAFDCLNHELLIAKLNAYGFSLPALRLINDYSLVGDNELELEIRLVISLKLYLEYPKGQY